MKPLPQILLSALLLIAARSSTAQVKGAPPQGDLTLPAQAIVFAPFAREDGVPAPELLRRVPETLVLGTKQAAGRAATFDARRGLDCAPFTGTAVGNTAWVYLAFTAAAAGPATFGFGADWWYEAYLDGTLISETLSRGDQGNEAWPPSIHDVTATVDVATGPHVLAVRLLRGSGSALLAVGGPLDLKNPAIRNAPKPAGASVTVSKAAYRDGPPAGKEWKLVWNDEFDGTALDTVKWNVQPVEPWNWPEITTKPSAANQFLDGNGALVLQLTRDPDGTVRHPGSINSRFEKAYGYVETRVQFSRQPGWWTAVWMAGYPYDCGVDAFTNSQEFDIFEDFYKPKKQNDISHCYHCSVKLAILAGDQGNAKGVGEGGILASAALGRTSSGGKAIMETYDGWHTVGFQWTPLEHIFYVDGQETLRQTYRDVPVTNVPQKVWISACLRAPKTKEEKPFYGRLEEAQLPDRLVVDYVRIYEHDTGARRLPRVTLAVKGTGPFKEGEPVTFDVSATAASGKVTSVMLFSMGRIRAERTADAATAQATFTVGNLFPGVANTIIAMAQDDTGLVGQSAPLRLERVTGKEFTGTPWQGKPQAIPGTVQGGCYDEGGNGIAFRSAALGPSDARLEYRKSELGALPEAVEVGGDYAQWLTYEVEVAAAGEYEVEVFMNRPDYSTKDQDPAAKVRVETLRLNLGQSGAAGVPLLSWPLATSWNSGAGWRAPQKSLGRQTVRLPAGRHKLVLFCNEVSVKFTFFCKLEFTPAATPEK
jgi:beta-glucanase (GH16 family)